MTEGSRGMERIFNVACAGLGLIGGSFFKAAAEAGYAAEGFHHGEKADFSRFDLILVSMPPSAIATWIRENCATFKDSAVVVDVCGVKRPLYEAFRLEGLKTKWMYVGGHPMAGREVSGYANSTPDLFKGASMILTPYPYAGRGVLDSLESFFLSLGFGRVVFTTPERHDEMIAFTSQLCHIISSAYVREPLAQDHVGFSAGSFRDMVRVGAPDPDVWTELFLLNRDRLSDVLGRYIARLEEFKSAIDANDAKRLKASLDEGLPAKRGILKNSPNLR